MSMPKIWDETSDKLGICSLLFESFSILISPSFPFMSYRRNKEEEVSQQTMRNKKGIVPSFIVYSIEVVSLVTINISLVFYTKEFSLLLP